MMTVHCWRCSAPIKLDGGAPLGLMLCADCTATTEREQAGDFTPTGFDPNFWATLPLRPPVRIPGGYPSGLFDSLEGVRELARIQHNSAREVMRRNGGGMPTIAYVFCRVDPIHAHPGDCLYSLQLREADEAYTDLSKDYFATIIRLMVTLGRARGVCTMGEAWFAQVTDAEKQDVIDKGLANHPGRREGLFLEMHTPLYRHLYTATFRRYSARSIVIDEWQHHADGKLSGRFDDVLRPLNLDNPSFAARMRDVQKSARP